MNRKQKIIVSVTGIFLVLLILMGLTYAYFLTRINGNPNDTSISVTTANLVLNYADGNGMLLPYGTIQPGDPIKFYTAKVGENGEYLTDEQGNYIPDQVVESKTFSVENKGNAEVNYAVILDNFGVYYASDATYDGTSVNAGDSTNFVYPNDFELEITCISNKGSCMGQTTTLPTTNTRLLTNDIGVGEIQEYTLTMTYTDSGIDQSADMNKTFTGRIDIIDTKSTVDIEGKIASYTPGDYIETNSVKRTSNIDSNGNYRILGLEPDTHTFKVMSKDGTAKVTKTLNITKGTESSVNGTDIVSTSDKRIFTINVGSNKEIETIDKNNLTGVTVSVLKATDEENQVDGLILYEKFSDAYNALKTYFAVTDSGGYSYDVANERFPEELTWTVYGAVDITDYASMKETLSGGVSDIIISKTGSKLSIINLIGGNDSAELISNHSGSNSSGFLKWTGNFTDFTNRGGVQVPIEVLIKDIKFTDSFVLTESSYANVTIDNCLFEGHNSIVPYGNYLIKNSQFLYNNKHYSDSHYGLYILENKVGAGTQFNIFNNVFKGSPRGVNIDTDHSDVIVRGNSISGIQLGARGGIQITNNNTLLIENNHIFDIDGNAFFFHDTYGSNGTSISNGITIRNNVIDTKYLAVFGDDVDTLDIPSTIATVTSSGNTVNVLEENKGITKQGTVQENGFTLN